MSEADKLELLRVNKALDEAEAKLEEQTEYAIAVNNSLIQYEQRNKELRAENAKLRAAIKNMSDCAYGNMEGACSEAFAAYEEFHRACESILAGQLEAPAEGGKVE